jgi:GH24 family phage-related lysozyme (muramidase)
MMFSKLANRIREIAAVADIRPRPKPDTIKRMNENLNQALEGAPVIPEPTAVPGLPPVTHRRTGKAGIDLMHQFEGCERKRPDGLFEAYLCPAKVWTIGWGSTGADPFNGGQIRKGTVWTQEQCDLRFQQHLAKFEEAVRDGIGKAPTSQAQFDAMVAWTYNVGIGAMRKSTLLRMHNAGDFDGAAKQFLRWNKANGKVLRGLTRRREAEAALYRSGS